MVFLLKIVWKNATILLGFDKFMLIAATSVLTSLYTQVN